MENEPYQYEQQYVPAGDSAVQTAPRHENVVAGIVGAFLFALVGGILWFLIYMLGFVAGIAGLVGVILAIKGYEIFAGKLSIKGVIIASVIALGVLVLAWYLCIGRDIYVAYQELYAEGEVPEALSFSESVQAIPFFMEDTETAVACFTDLAFGLVFALVASIGTIVTTVKNLKAQKASAVDNYN